MKHPEIQLSFALMAFQKAIKTWPLGNYEAKVQESYTVCLHMGVYHVWAAGKGLVGFFLLFNVCIVLLLSVSCSML